MLKISIIDTRTERRLVVEGTLVQPWIEELERTWRGAGEDLQGRKLVVDLSHATVTGKEGEDVLFGLMRQGAKFSCGGVHTRYVIKQLAHRCHDWMCRVTQEEEAIGSDSDRTEVHVDAGKEQF